ncbi:MAG: PKD domain-containing protein [Candidatus Bipolaricaulis sp.]|nr:PKD domain-containing protein [Candidatus Bipolaricaulis sp.]
MHRTRRARLGEALLLAAAGLVAASVIGMAQAAPQVRQPDDPSYPPEVRASLARGIQALGTVLGTPYTGSQNVPGYGGWGSREFAIFTAGALGERGYPTAVVRADDSANARTWVLVGISAAGAVVWVPVEPVPGAGLPQTTLGRIPMTENAFPSNYTTYTSTVPVPPNAAPTARIRPPSTRAMPGQTTALSALGSSDPDGYIVAYRWDFGDGTTAVFSDSTVYHNFATAGHYTVTLIAIDNGGRSSAAAWTLTVGLDAPQPTPGSGCGCGG